MGRPASWLWLRRFLALFIAISVISFGSYILMMGNPNAPVWLLSLFGPVVDAIYAVYLPALALAYAIATSDMPLFEFGFFALVENVLLAMVLATIWSWAAGRRRTRDTASSNTRRTDADPA